MALLFPFSVAKAMLHAAITGSIADFWGAHQCSPKICTYMMYAAITTEGKVVYFRQETCDVSKKPNADSL